MDYIRRLGGPPPRQPRVVVTAAIDATDGNVDAHALHRVRELADAVRESAGDIAATVDLYRTPGRTEPNTYLDRLLASEQSFPFAETRGGPQTFQLEASRLHRGTPSGRAVVGDAETSLARNLADNHRRYPNAIHLVYAYGHRSQGDKVAGMRVDRLPQALRAGADVMLLDTCWGSSVDTLAQIPRTVKTVVAAQTRLLESVRAEGFFTPVFETQFPLRRVVHAIARQSGAAAEALAGTVVREGSREHAPHVIAATDMASFHDHLLPALAQLGQSLPATARPTEGVAPVTDGPAQFSDLAGYLRHLGASPLSAAATTATRAVSAALSRTLVARHASPGLEDQGGLSFHLVPGATLPAAWKSLLGEPVVMRPQD